MGMDLDGSPDTLAVPPLCPVPGVILVPIRHHSPVCAEAVSALISRERPSRVLIEMPSDFEPHIPLLLDERTVPPVAIVALARRGSGVEQEELAGSYPFSIHSPEFVAVREGVAAGAAIRFIDRASDARLLDSREGAQEDAERPPAEPLAADDGLTGGRYIKVLCERTGCRDGFELWDRLFESRLGCTEPEAVLSDIMAYCTAIRAATPDSVIVNDDTLGREAEMIAHIHDAMNEREVDDGPILVVIGGFHAPPLAEAAKRIAAGDAPPTPSRPTSEARSWLTRYGMRELDALNAYGAGLPSPGWYDAVWHKRSEGGQPDLAAVTSNLMLTHRRNLPDGMAPPIPSTVEALRLADGLAAMRGLPGPMRAEIEDAARTAYVKGEAGRGLAGASDPVIASLREFMAGTAIGDVPPSAGSPPLLESVREWARAYRFDVEDGTERRRDLDIRRNPRHARISAFLHALDLIGAGFARRETGPDFAGGTRLDLVNETWTVAWSHRVEARLVERSVLGSTLEGAALRTLARDFAAQAQGGEARDSAASVRLLGRGLIAGLGAALRPLAVRIERTIAEEPRFAGAAGALRRLNALERGTRALAGDRALDLTPLSQAAYRRMLFLIPTLGDTALERTSEVLDAMRDAAAAAREFEEQDGRADGDGAFHRALVRLAAGEDARNPAITASVMALARTGEPAIGQALVRAVRGSLGGVALSGDARVAVLRGAISADPSVLWSVPGLLDAVDDVLRDFDENDFLGALPELRLAFTALNPRETDRVAEELVAHHGENARHLVRIEQTATLEEAARGAMIDAAVAASLRNDGLGAWLEDVA